MTNNNGFKYISLVFGIVIILSLSGIPYTSQQTVSANKSSDSHEMSKSDVSGKAVGKADDKQEISHKQIVSLTGSFMNKLLQEINDDNKVIRYDTKEELLNEFKKISSEEVAARYIDFYFNEKEDGLYIKPTETPPWFQENNDYDMIQQDDNTVVVNQKNTSQLYGTYIVEFEFTWVNNQWKISDITHK
ncbi:hypothetical protein GCM10007063_22500 [Lentibacillus kapialis]|uniref:DUF3993 domain-containing protein n=1 Tax=Lentibacillus kapialis TaxID=340214 RepID=A0A917PXS6_9BACI|nr:hypothetical protein [Lentibacillus kapialis]GGJ99664.1 hypothetical protein GCM10007063_22500 [Lentibacillus kapialis]